MSHGDEWTSEDRQSFGGFFSRLDTLVEKRLAEYRRTNVYVFDMSIDADDGSTDGPPNLWVARDHYTGELIQRLTGAELEDFYAEHEEWVEYSGLVDELEDQLKDEPQQRRQGIMLTDGARAHAAVSLPSLAPMDV